MTQLTASPGAPALSWILTNSSNHSNCNTCLSALHRHEARHRPLLSSEFDPRPVRFVENVQVWQDFFFSLVLRNYSTSAPYLHLFIFNRRRVFFLFSSSSSSFSLHHFGPSPVHHLPCPPPAGALMPQPMYSGFSFWPTGQLASTLRFPNYSSAFQLTFLV